MKLEPLYRLDFRYVRHWEAEVAGQTHQLLEGEGRAEGRINGAFHGTNRARKRTDSVYEPDYHGVIETDDGAAIIWDLSGYGFPDEGRVVVTIKHRTDDERYAWLNRVVCVGAGELERDERGITVSIAVSELVWEPIR